MTDTVVEILFIEDNPHEAELAIRSLKQHNLVNNLKHIDDGEEAVDYIFQRGIYSGRQNSILPKLIILDLKLPKVDGLEILRQLKADDRTRKIPVVVLTSSQEEKDVVESYRLGVNSYIVKPVNFESFGKAVAELGLYWVILNHRPNA
jgi:two-component system, response regulator